MGETYRRTNITATLHQSGLDGKWPNSSFSSVKIHETLIVITKIHQITQTMKKKILWCNEPQSLFLSEGNQAPLFTCIIPSQQWSMASCSGGVFQRQGLNAAKYRDIFNENLVLSAQNLRLGWKFTFQHDNHPTHTAKTMQEWLRDDSMNVLEWPSPAGTWKQSDSLEKTYKCPVHRWSPANLTELEMI